MKIIYSIILFMFATFVIHAQPTWTTKTNFGGVARWGAVAFSIGTKGYVGMGNSGSNKKDFWEWDQATNTWTQKADFGGTARYQPVGFSIGSKGYIGTGAAGSSFPYSPLYNDFWEYDPATNVWTSKAPFGGTVRFGAVGFSIGNKGYIGTGFNDVTYFQNDFWEYDPLTDVWTQKTNFAGAKRMEAVGFSMGDKGYIGTGGNYMSGTVLYNDFWEYDPSSNAWTLKAPFGGVGRSMAVGFAMNDKGYIGLGGNFSSTSYADFWQFDKATNTWISMGNFSGTARWLAASFSIGNFGYVATGGNFAPTYKDLWEFSPGLLGQYEEDENNLISIYPNPSNGIFNLQNPELIKSIAVYNAAGEKIIQSGNINANRLIDLSNQPAGIYVLQAITKQERIFCKKIIKE
jgi:N-acetylneuraminic acid mutarotase